ncbi:MAG: amidohydrolase [Betaproteobacteria bacterium]|nr:amidohydrolase [Betaproteobacteria bacterium]
MKSSINQNDTVGACDNFFYLFRRRLNMTTPSLRFEAAIHEHADRLEPKVLAWRRDIHANPELGNREMRTGKLVADHLRSLGFDQVQEQVAYTGVVGVLKGGKPGPVVALRADMDGLPVTEETDVPFKSTVRTTWNGAECGVMHACGHDTHVAILMGVAELLAGLREEIAGTIKFIFQPAEEMPPIGEDGGARLMIEQGCMENPKVEAIFGLHITSKLHTNTIGYRVGPLMASADQFRIFVRGNQTHGAQPWSGVDPIVVGSQIVLGLQTIVSRKMDLTQEPSVVTVGSFQAGNRSNIIPDEAKMEGTIRTFDEGHREEIHGFVQKISTLIAEAGGAKAHVHIARGYPVTINDEPLTHWSVPVLKRMAGEGHVGVCPKTCGAEDFSYYQQQVPGFFFFIGCTPPDQDCKYAPSNHSPRFYVDEAGLKLGVKSLAALGLTWLDAHSANA